MRQARARRRRILFGLLLSVAALGVEATEPDGVVSFRYAWEPDDRLRLTIQSFAPLADVVVTWTGVPGASLRAVRAEGERAPEARPGGERLLLGRLADRTARTFLLEIDGERTAAASGAIAVVRLEALFRGHAIQEALGIPLARGTPGRLRLDAIEFDAADGTGP